ncbi:MAG: Gfo/Idh/MocA family oxidoreductase [Ruthenibacterium sp.]
MKPMKAVIIGCGNIFPMHAVSVTKLAPEVQLVAVCDNKIERAQAAAAQYHCKMYQDYKEMLDIEKPDAVHICTPHYLHPEMAIYALTHGINVLCEKPVAIELADALRMEQAAAENKKVLMVSFQSRFNPASVLMKQTLESGALGKILSARAMITWNRSDAYYSQSDWKGTWDKEGGGVIIDQAIHTLDLMNWLIDSPFVKVEAFLANRAHHVIDVDDCADGVITYENGVKASFFAINYYAYDAPVEIEMYCENGIVKLVGEQATIRFFDGHTLSAERNPNEIFDFGDVKQYWGVGHQKEIAHFYDCLATGKKPCNTVTEVMPTERLICAIYKQGRKNWK